MEIYTFQDPAFGINTYLVAEEHKGFLIDPLISVFLEDFLEKLDIDFAVLTHEHYDHICGVNEIRKKYGIKFLCGRKAEKGLADPKINMSKYTEYFNAILPFGNGTAESCAYMCCCDSVVTDQQIIHWEGHQLFIKETPGHSNGSISILLDNLYLFSGDAIFREYQTATRLPGGSTMDYNKVTVPWLNSLNPDIMVYPGHGLSFTLNERFK